LQLAAYQEERESLAHRIEHHEELLEVLKRTNVHNDLFHVSTSGALATINGFRLGSLPPQETVSWPEINAALGQAALLLNLLARHAKFSFSQFKIQPLGNATKLVSVRDARQTLDLFNNGGEGLVGRMLKYYGKFDTAMVAFAHCVQELEGHVATLDPKFAPPYR